MSKDASATVGIRLQKVLADAGVASRRAAERLIDEGRVSVDGVIVTVQGTRVDPARATIRVDGERIPVVSGQVFLVANKPRGMVSTMADPQGRPCLADLVADRQERLFHVGRLDAETEGIIVLTNDGATAHRLAHPSFGVQKVYRAIVSSPLGRDVGSRLRKGVELSDGVVAVDAFRVIDESGGQVQVELTLHSGRNHVVRRLLEEVGHPVRRLVRTQFGPVRLGRLRPGGVRVLSRSEVGRLLDELDGQEEATQHDEHL